jgi:hypothetical protein
VGVIKAELALLHRTWKRPKRGVAAVAIVLLSLAMATAAGAQNDSSNDDEMADRRVAGFGDDVAGRTEAGVGVTGIGGLVDADGGTSGGSSGSPVPGCQWAVVYVPGASSTENVGALERAAEMRGLASGGVVPDQEWMESSLETLAHELVAQGAADREDLRYVTPYAPEGVDAAECNTDPGAWVTITEVEDLALVAFSEVEENWPAQEVVLGWPEPTEDTWTALSTGMPWEPVAATASDGGLVVTVTATPERVVWDLGEIQTRVGAPGSVVCDGPGDLPLMQADASCRVWFAGPSTGLIDQAGQVDAITLGVTVEWGVGYESNFAGFADTDWLEWPTTSVLDGVVVNTSQAVGTTGGGSGA